MKLVEQEVAPRYEPGVDYGAQGVVLIRKGDIRLIWRSGGMVWSGTGQPFNYFPTSLELRCGSGRMDNHLHGRMDKDLHEGGRLCHKRIRENIEAIRKAFSEPELSALEIDVKKTLVIGEGE